MLTKNRKEEPERSRGCFGTTNAQQKKKEVESRPKTTLKVQHLVRRNNYIYKFEEVKAATIIAREWRLYKSHKRSKKYSKLSIL